MGRARRPTTTRRRSFSFGPTSASSLNSNRKSLPRPTVTIQASTPPSRGTSTLTASGQKSLSPESHLTTEIVPGQPFEEPVKLPIEEALDLHPFAPNDIPSVVEEYLVQCRQTGLSEVRLIHGKGIGAQRAVVRRLLANHPDVLSFADAPSQAGGWGATLVRLKPL